MSRDDGFPIADVDTGLFSDAKVKALARRLKDPHLTAEYLCLWTAVLLESWGEGERVPFVDGVPAWFTDDVDVAVEHLTAVGMLVDDHIPSDSWSRWFGPAWDRREKRRQSGREGGLSSAKGRSSDATPTLDHGSNGAEPVRPSVSPSDKPPVLRPLRSSRTVIEAAEEYRKGES